MATTSGRYIHGSSGMGSSSNPTQEGFWSYAVPSQKENAPIVDPNIQSIADDMYTREQRLPLSQQSSLSARPRTRHSAKSRQASESGYITAGGLRPPYLEHQNASGGSSEADSLLDLYKGNSGDHHDRQRVKRKGSRGAVATMDEPIAEDKESKWIHRDKLMQIESRELAEMGVRHGRPSRAGSRTKSVRTVKSSVDVNEGTQEEVPNVEEALREGKRLRQRSPSPKAEDVALRDGEVDPQLEFARHVSQREHEQPPARPGTSRIPISSNATSFGSENERYAGQHARNGSMSSTGPRRDMMKQRARSRSGGSQNMLDMASSPQTPDMREPASPSNGQTSPSKHRAPSKGAPGSDSRTPSSTRKFSGTRARSGSAAMNGGSPKRPNTSGGSRPPTARPEGEAPWIATMYKPDPMIPPDEQMLPTHAKRLAQMQHEAEDQAAQQAREDQETSEYVLLESEEQSRQRLRDSDIPAHESLGTDQRNSALHDGSRDSNYSRTNRNSTHGHHRELSEKLEGGQWPLRSPSPDEVQQQQYEQSKLEQSAWANGKPSGTGTGENRGYGLMPNTQSTNDRQSQRMSQRSRNSNISSGQREGRTSLAPVDQPVRLREPSEEVVHKKKGCGGCCAVM
ncbi:MAG: hypothetical protein M1828_005907 [Chrysothrix sp. TS-e1954]|nr:MAG: hypothetical protein M1828_005907 [Chrysothrix sp. TS-e1954]